MPVVIEELRTEVLPEPTRGDGAAAASHGQPADGPAPQATLDLIELARERELRLVCD
jgi:hypothetical protein